MRDTVVARVLPTCRLHCGSDLRVRLIELQLVANIIFIVNCSCVCARVCMCALLSLHRSGIVAQNIEPSPLRRAARHDERCAEGASQRQPVKKHPIFASTNAPKALDITLSLTSRLAVLIVIYWSVQSAVRTFIHSARYINTCTLCTVVH